MQADISDLAQAGREFARLAETHRRNGGRAFDWYPYDSLAILPILAQMLRGERRDLVALAGTAPILDIGCADGSLSFFFESLGCRVVAIDHPDSNHNHMLGFERLRTLLRSSVELQLQDIDYGLDLQGRTFGLALLLGVLYHLKSPFTVLETLARHTRYCLLSTRIAEVTLQGARIREEPVAYLLDRAEANNDPTNYWIFSEAGLTRLLERSGWEICDYTTFGCASGSDPSGDDRDQRYVCMLRSRMADPWGAADLLEGWHALEHNCWRWTERSFSVRLQPRGVRLRFRFHLPSALLDAGGAVLMRAFVNGEALAEQEYASAGEHVYEHTLPSAIADGEAVIRFELDRALLPGAQDARELGVQVIFHSGSRALYPIVIK